MAEATGAAVARLFAELGAAGFGGDRESGVGARHVASTDNSIYQLLPAAIVYPRSGDDVTTLVQALRRSGAPLSLTARGGDTGTNGQSLNTGVIVDFGRHMRGIGAFDPVANTVVVEPGVVLDQLNAFLAPHGRFFPPMVSTASRATIGGMVATDASGKGSRRWGKTSDYIAAIDLTLADGTSWRAEPMTRAAAEEIARGTGIVADIHREVLRIVTTRADEIAAIFPRMNRGLTGYNLQRTWDAGSDRFFLGYLLAGSEGTLALTRSITLNVAARPRRRALAVIRYDTFDGAMRDVQRLIAAGPDAIEIIDDKILGVARSDIIWTGVEALLGGTGDRPVAAMNFVEFTGDDDAAIAAGLDRLAVIGPAGDCRIVRDAAQIRQLWSLREKSVGLLARLGGARQGIPFVEDTAVPPERLADYVAEFRALLDRHNLQYGMFGHADVGCLHVRPFLDLRDPAQAALIRPISDAVAQLTKSYGGLLWGEHGRGFRGEYSPLFFGDLYPELVQLKTVFDPDNRLNPGKLAAPAGHAVDRIDGVPLRADADRDIADANAQAFDRAVACNGNGACHAWDALDVMCPSYKATRDRAQSPKGRAALLRSWARLDSIADPTPAERAERDAIAADTRRSLSTCLSCKACTTLCPVKVDIPTMKSRFAARTTRRRPLRHHVLARMEPMLAVARRMPAVANLMLGTRAARAALARLGYVDLPRFAVADTRTLPPVATTAAVAALPPERRATTVVLVEDSFTASFDGTVLTAAARVLSACGFTVMRLPARSNGKALHLIGMRDRFARIARARVAEARELAATGVRLVGLDAATALMFSQEFTELTGESVDVAGLESVLAHGNPVRQVDSGAEPCRLLGPYRLLGHCTEQALRPLALAGWATALARFGIAAQPVRTGCCGMAGLFGHETAQQRLSKEIFALSWAEATRDDWVLATGFSCRCQTARMTGRRPLHPVELIDRILT
jgi:FAD/FMN-containing dehydrogenase/Fe-S oxidoreductase